MGIVQQEYKSMIRKLMRIGNSVGVTLDKKILRSLGMEGDSYLVIESDAKNKRILIRKRKKNEW